MVRWFLLAAVLAIILYVVIAVCYVLDFCHWAPRRMSYEGFRWEYNELEDMKRRMDLEYEIISKHEGRRKHYDINHFLVMSFYVRRGDISQDVEFAVWPFGIRSYYGYAHPPGE